MQVSQSKQGCRDAVCVCVLGRGLHRAGPPSSCTTAAAAAVWTDKYINDTGR